MRIIKIYHILVLKLVDPGAPLIEDVPDINPKSRKRFRRSKKFTKKDKFLLFQGRIYVPTKLRSKIIANYYKLLIYKY